MRQRGDARLGWTRSPLLHFLAIGAALFSLEGLFANGANAAPERLVLTPESRAQLAAITRRELGREPTAAELEGRIARWIDEELLLREARALGWHRTDPVIHMRLAQNQRFLLQGTEADAASDEQLVARAFEMGMDRSDLVVRRRLAERMRLAIAAAALDREPTDAALAEILAADPGRYRRPALVELTQVFRSRDRRGNALDADAAALKATLVANSTTPEIAVRRADPSLVPARLPLSSERALGSRLGPAFAKEALAAPVGRWVGPIESAYGEHVVWVHQRIPARDPTVEEARRELRTAWRTERERTALREALDGLRNNVVISRPGAL